MEISLEKPDKNTIQTYSDQEIMVNSTHYRSSVIISQESIIANWPIYSLNELTDETLEPILSLQPEVILIGHPLLAVQAPINVLQRLSKQRVGLECMTIGAACRTYNVLLSEQRSVVIGIIFAKKF